MAKTGGAQSEAFDFLKGPLKKSVSEATRLYNQQKGFNVPNFQTWVPYSDTTKQGMQGILGQAGQGNPLAGQSQEALSGILGGDPITSEFRQLVDTEAGKLGDDITRQFGGASFGSAGHTNALTSGIGDFRNRMIAGQYNQGVANQLNAVSAAPGVYEQQFAPYQKMLQVGGMQDDLATRQLQSELDKFNAGQNEPWSRLNALLGVATGAGSPYYNMASTQTPSNPFMSALGGGLLGYQGGAQGGGSGFGGALLGGGLLGSLFSDRRLKQDIKRVGKTKDGTPIYTYRYKAGVLSDEPSPVVMGVMAQEVQRKRPEAVTKLPGGILAVDYAKAA